jgi:hypothetical protein
MASVSCGSRRERLHKRSIGVSRLPFVRYAFFSSASLADGSTPRRSSIAQARSTSSQSQRKGRISPSLYESSSKGKHRTESRVGYHYKYEGVSKGKLLCTIYVVLSSLVNIDVRERGRRQAQPLLPTSGCSPFPSASSERPASCSDPPLSPLPSHAS